MTRACLFSILSAATAGRSPSRCVIYVDPCQGDVHDDRLTLIQEACESAGVEVVPVWSAGYARMICSRSSTTTEEADDIRAKLEPSFGEEASWAADRLQGMHVLDVVCGSDAGLACSERMLNALAPERSNGLLRARRDKFLMNEALRARGLDAVRQAVASSWPEASAFVTSLPQPLAVVVKPRRGSASLRVGLARSIDEAARCFERVLELPSTLDESEEGLVSTVLLQEYLQGEEWIVDTMSRDGEHKVTRGMNAMAPDLPCMQLLTTAPIPSAQVLALWRYDKGEANGAPFCYFGAEPVGCTGAHARRVVDYALAVLDALQWRWGPVHMEVMWVSGTAKAASGAEADETEGARGPVLIEANMGRHNGLEFKLLCEVVYGRTMYEAQLAVLMGDEAAWAALPALPDDATLRCAGRLVTLVASVSGALTAINHMDAIEALESVASVQLEANEPGDQVIAAIISLQFLPSSASDRFPHQVKCTIDLNTCAGQIILLHADRAVIERDYQTLRALQPTLFEVAADADARVSDPGEAADADARSTRRRLEAEEALRIARAVVGACTPLPPGAPTRPLRVLVARFPLLEEDFEVSVPASSRAACEYAELPRELGDALLRAVRTAKDEPDAMRNCEALVGTVGIVQ